MTYSFLGQFPQKAAADLLFCQKKMPDTCGVWEAGANDFIELNHFLTRFTSTCAVSCDFDKFETAVKKTSFFFVQTGGW